MSWITLFIFSFSFYSCSEVMESKESQVAKTEVVQRTIVQDTVDSQAEIIEQIKKLSNSIDTNLKNYKQIDTIDFDYSIEGTELIGYYKGSNIKKVIAKHAGETGYAIEEYYFDDRKPILVKNRVTFYKNPIYESDSTIIESVSEELFYFYNGTLIKWIQNENEMSEEKDNYQEKTKQLLKSAREYMEVLKQN